MEYTNIISEVPEGENFDATAVNEGVWLSVGHLKNIETKLAENGTFFNSIKEQLSTEQLKAQQAEESLVAANQSIAEKDAEIVRLKAAPAGEMKNTGKEKDEHNDGAAQAVSPVTAEANRLRAIRDGKK